MKRTLLITIGFLFSFMFSKAQAPGFIVPLDEHMKQVIDMIYTAEGNFVISGSIDNEFYVDVTCINKEGDILWNNLYPTSMRWYAGIMQKSNGNLLIPMGFTPALLELSPTGDSIGSLILDSPYPHRSFFGTAIEMSDHTIIATEIVTNNDPIFYSVDSSFLVKISPEGDIIAKYPSRVNDIKDIIATPDDKIIAVVQADSSIENQIVKYNMSGEVLSTSSCASYEGADFYRIEQLNNNNYVTSGYTWTINSTMKAVLGLSDQNGQIMDCKDYADHYYMDVTKDESNYRMYALGNRDDSCYITTLDYSGNFISEYLVSDTLDGVSIIYHDDFFYIAVVSKPSYHTRGYFIKISKNSLLSVNDNRGISAFAVYPNPASEYVVFENPSAPGRGTEQDAIIIFDVFGQKVAEMPMTGGKTVWDCREMKAGVYFYSITYGNEVRSGKAIINN